MTHHKPKSNSELQRDLHRVQVAHARLPMDYEWRDATLAPTGVMLRVEVKDHHGTFQPKALYIRQEDGSFLVAHSKLTAVPEIVRWRRPTRSETDQHQERAQRFQRYGYGEL